MDIYCSVIDGQLESIGTLNDVLFQTYKPRIDENRKLILNPKNYRETSLHSYSKDYSPEEIWCDVNRFLLSDTVKNKYPSIEIFKKV